MSWLWSWWPTLTLNEWWWLTGTLFYAASIAAALWGVYEYMTGVRQRVGQAIFDLEQEFSKHGNIRWILDPAAPALDGTTSTEQLADPRLKLAATLRDAIPKAHRDPNEHELVRQLDAFLRFLLLLAGLQRHNLINRKAIRFMYWYWFSAVKKATWVEGYVQKFFPSLHHFMEADPKIATSPIPAASAGPPTKPADEKQQQNGKGEEQQQQGGG